MYLCGIVYVLALAQNNSLGEQRAPSYLFVKNLTIILKSKHGYVI
jgi:hypothetical protein